MSLFICLVILIIYEFGLFIPQKTNYCFVTDLEVKPGAVSKDYESCEPIFGTKACVELNIMSTSIRNYCYDEGYVLINGRKFIVENVRYRPRSLAAKLKSEMYFFAEMIKPNYDMYWFVIEPFFDYKITVYGYENRTYVEIQIEIDGDQICSYVPS